MISEAEVADWLATFGPVDERAIRNRPKPIPPNLPPPEPEPVNTPDTPPLPLNREEPQLSNKELDEWLALFGGEPKKKKPTKEMRPTTPTAPATAVPPKPRRSRPSTNNPHNLSPDDLAAWQDFANRDE